jgi:hypothetical protein
MRTVDKLDKIGPDKVREPSHGRLTASLPKQADEIRARFIAIRGTNERGARQA